MSPAPPHARRALLLLALLPALAAAPAHAGCAFLCGIEVNGTLPASGAVDAAYREVLGRGATRQELADWAARGYPDSAPGSTGGSTAGAVRALLLRQLRNNAALLAEVVTRVATDSIGARLSPNNPLQGLLTRLAQKPGSTYLSLLEFTRTYLQDPQVDGLRAGLIERAYVDSLGRLPSAGDAAYWQAQIRKTGANYADLLRAGEEWVLSAGNEAEFAAMIRRAFQMTGRPPPGMDRIAQIRVKSGATLRTFSGWKTFIQAF